MTTKKYIHKSRTRELFKRYATDKASVIGLIIVIAFVLIAIFAPILSPYDPDVMKFTRFSPPSDEHLMGTDSFGRDVISRVIWGTRISIIFGVLAAGLSLIIGVVVGSIAGYFGGNVDMIISRISEIVLMMPSLFVIMIVVSYFGSSLKYAVFVVALTQWPWNAKIARSQVLSVKNRPFVDSAIVAGASKIRVLFVHVIPNGIFPVITNTILQISGAILMEASLGFLGLGDPSMISWGQMLRLAQISPRREPWTVAFAGMAIFLLILGFNFVGNGINYTFNPKITSQRK